MKFSKRKSKKMLSTIQRSRLEINFHSNGNSSRKITSNLDSDKIFEKQVSLTKERVFYLAKVYIHHAYHIPNTSEDVCSSSANCEKNPLVFPLKKKIPTYSKNKNPLT